MVRLRFHRASPSSEAGRLALRSELRGLTRSLAVWIGTTLALLNDLIGPLGRILTYTGEQMMAAVMDYPLTRQGVRDLDRPRGPRPVKVMRSNRAMVAFAGAVVAGFGLGQGGIGGLLLAAAGGAVACPWITGRFSMRD